MITWNEWRKLHPVTKLMAACAGIGLVVFAVTLVGLLQPIVQYGAAPGDGGFFADAVTRAAYDLIWSLGFLGTAASVEFLYRIWREIAGAGDAS